MKRKTKSRSCKNEVRKRDHFRWKVQRWHLRVSSNHTVREWFHKATWWLQTLLSKQLQGENRYAGSIPGQTRVSSGRLPSSKSEPRIADLSTDASRRPRRGEVWSQRAYASETLNWEWVESRYRQQIDKRLESLHGLPTGASRDSFATLVGDWSLDRTFDAQTCHGLR